MTGNSKIKGKIIKSVGGNFHVETSGGLIICGARGLFRLHNISPCAGDNVTLEITDNNPLIIDIEERKNHIVRPPLSNLDAAVIVVSTVEPSPNRLILDKLIAIFESKNITPALIFTKTDKKEETELKDIYNKAGFSVFSISNINGCGVSETKSFLFGKTSAFIGNTGVGKSSTLNSLFPDLLLETGEISKKLGRGKHTTRHVELFKLSEGGYIADTPGFSTVEAAKYGDLNSKDIASFFREFIPYLDKCKFAGCRHTKETGCAIIDAVNRKEISESRFESYVKIFEDARIEENTYKKK